MDAIECKARELVKRWVIESNWRSGGVRATYKRCANELEAALAQAPTRNPWQEAVDEARVTAHLGIAADGVTREQATAQLGELIDWHIAVAMDPAVNGGFKLVPVAQAPAVRGDSP